MLTTFVRARLCSIAFSDVSDKFCTASDDLLNYLTNQLVNMGNSVVVEALILQSDAIHITVVSR